MAADETAGVDHFFATTAFDVPEFIAVDTFVGYFFHDAVFLCELI